ncbi:MAG: glycoside hydrolase family 65 protein [Clostridiaceae bacterium]|nr:glycoside hydrolase family 65 protein [Clostridiaceae bacterium]
MSIYKIEPIPLAAESLILHETIFHNANGYLGVRGCSEEKYPHIPTVRGMYVNGFYDIIDMKQAEPLYGLVNEKQTTLNLADVFSIDLYIDGEKFSMFEGEILKSFRLLDMDRGVTQRYIEWRSPKGHEIIIDITRMASFTKLSIFTIDYTVQSCNFSGEVRFVSTHSGDVRNFSDPSDPRLATESVQNLFVSNVSIENNCSFIDADTSRSKQAVCTGVAHTISNPCKVDYVASDNDVIWALTTRVNKGEKVRMVKYACVTDTIHHNLNYREINRTILKNATDLGVDVLYKDQFQYLSGFWEHCAMKIDGDDQIDNAMRYNMYQMAQSVSKDQYGNIAAKGLSGEGYEGHYFWDTEMYLQPFFLLTMPGLCRNLIGFRYNTLDKARENARLLGHKSGALYPWRTIDGSECSGYYVSGTAAYHINGAIGHSVSQYFLATEDYGFLKEMGAEMLAEIARLWLDVGNFHEGKFHINCVTGPDEYTCMVNNNYYTNFIAKQNLYWAAKAFNLIGEEDKKRLNITQKEVDEWILAADSMYLPYDEELGIYPQDDSFLQKKVWDFSGTPKEHHPLLLHYHPLHLYRFQVCKQADTVLSFLISEQDPPKDIMRRTFEYYEKITTHDSSLSSCVFSIVASMLGDVNKAYEYLGDSAQMDLFNTHRNTKDGIHTANMGGSYMAVVFGFAGVKINEKGLNFHPQIPAEWDKYSFRIFYRGSLIEVTISQGESSFKLISGPSLKIHVDGKSLILDGPSS